MANTIETFAQFIARALLPVARALEGTDVHINLYVERLGWNLPSVPPAFHGLQFTSRNMLKSLALLESRISAHEDGLASSENVFEAGGRLLIDLGLFTAQIYALPDLLRSQLPVDYLSTTCIAEEIQQRIFEDAIVSLIAEEALTTSQILSSLGILETRNEPADPAVYQPGFVRRRIRWNRIPLLFKDPKGLLREVYGWGTPTIDAQHLFGALQDLATSLYVMAIFDYPSPSLIERLLPGVTISETEAPTPLLQFPLVDTEFLDLSLALFPIPKASSTELQGLALSLIGRGEINLATAVGPMLTLETTSTVDLASGIALALLPDQAPKVIGDMLSEGTNPITDGQAGLRLAYGQKDAKERVTLLSIPGGSGLEAKQIYLGAGIEARSGGGDYAFVEIGIVEGQLVISSAESDGFIRKILPEEPIHVDFDLRSGFSTKEGFYIEGAAGFEYAIPINKSFGPIFINSVYLKLEASEEKLALITATSGGAEIGPVTAVVQEIGLKTMLEFGKPGLLGNAQLSIDFKPPSGIGLSIDASGFSGGGFLRIDPPNYAGVFQLSYQNQIDLTAFGLIATKLPDGKPGFSLLISILAEFQPIQLGLGFALTGVGGLIAINRQFNEEAIKTAFKTHSLDAILFPPNPIKDAVKLIDSLQSIFPPREGYHVFGPMAKLFWGGSLRIVNFEIGIFIQLGGPLKIVLIGQAWSRLPNEDSPLLVINVDVLGIIDFGEQCVAFYATLFDSRIRDIHLDGQMALRADWTEGEENFALSVGGFHPRFQQIPPGFPQLRRLAAVVGDNPRLSLTMYLAITSNTFQVGAKLELWAKKLGFTITGGASFDALITFIPFSFLVTINVWVNVKGGGIDLGLWLELELSGPNPIVASGYVKIKLGWFFSVKVRFRAEFGIKISEALTLVSPLAILIAELANPRAIRFELPAWASANLAFAERGEMRIDPIADLTVVQSAVPLNFVLEKFGGGMVGEAEKVLKVTAGFEASREQAARSLFAAEQFKNWTVEERLSARPFEQFEAGIRLQGEYVIGEEWKEEREIVFETILRESKEYLGSLPEKDYRKAAIRTTCLWQPVGGEMEMLKDWAIFGGGRYYRPVRARGDESSPNYVKVIEHGYRLTIESE